MSGAITQAALVGKLLDRVSKHGEQRRLAEAAGCTPAEINMTVNGRRGISPRIANALGYRPVTLYVPIEGKTS